MGSLFPPTRFLFGPGPTQIEPRVYEAMAKPMVGYLDPFFFEVNEEVRTGLQQLFGTKNEFTLAISGTGSAGMEAAVSNFVDPGASCWSSPRAISPSASPKWDAAMAPISSAAKN